MKYFNIIALGALTAKLTIIDGVLMQRATGTMNAMDSGVTVHGIQGFTNETFPETGWANTQNEPQLMTHWMGDTFKLWSKMGGRYPSQWMGCEQGICLADVSGIGFAFNCTDPKRTNVDYGQTLPQTKDSAPLFGVNFWPTYSPPGDTEGFSYLTLGVSYLESNPTSIYKNGTKSCPARLIEQSCMLRPAVIKYPIEIQDSIGGMGGGSMGVTVGVNQQAYMGAMTGATDGYLNQKGMQLNGYEVIRYLAIHEEHGNNDYGPSFLAGIQLGLQTYLTGNASMSWLAPDDFTIIQGGAAAQFLVEPPSSQDECSYTYANPLVPYHRADDHFRLPSALQKINEVMFGKSPK